MKERPIIFSGPMVRAILEGRKTQTRRVVKQQPIAGSVYETHDAGVYGAQTGKSVVNYFHCPYGQPGERLWVRESFRLFDIVADCYHDDVCRCASRAGEILYMADEEYDGPWKPSIYMPRAASRITLEVTAVRVERLQDISEADAKAEGIGRADGAWESYDNIMYRYAAPKNSFRSLWQSIKGPDSWGANPWVWVVEFKRVQP